MKAIVNSMDLKAVEPGLHARAAKPGGTALFDPLFAMTSAPVSDETSMAAEVGAEVLPDDPQTPSASWLVEVGAANPAPGFTVPAAQSMDPKVVQAALAAAVPTKTDTTLENGQLSGEATPLSWLVYEQQAAASGQKGAGFVGPLADGVVAAQLQVTEMTPVTQAPSPLPDAMSPQAEQLSDVPVIQLSSVDAMSPQAEQLADVPLIQLSSADAVSKMAFAHLTAQQLADSAALHMTDTVAMKANPVLASG